jgi:hypothetical protein
MQPEPIETSNNVFTQITAPQPVNASQHGILSEQLHPAAVRDPLDETHISAEPSPSPNAANARSSGDARLHEELRRLSLGDRNETRPKPSFQRISEYENALTPSPPRKQSEGPGFKIIKKKGNRLDGPQLDEFPNGMYYLPCEITAKFFVLTVG